MRICQLGPEPCVTLAFIWDSQNFGRELALQGAVHTTDHRFQRGHHDVLIDAHAKQRCAIRQPQLHISHRTGIGPVAHGVFAVAYVELRLADGTTLFGVGIDKNIVVASLKAVVSGVNRALKR